jgi:hypothetical protein
MDWLRLPRKLLIANGVKSTLVLVPKEDESCFCMGTPTEPAAAGSPFSPACKHAEWGKQCSTMGGLDCCIAHTMGAAVVLGPLIKFALTHLRRAARQFVIYKC